MLNTVKNIDNGRRMVLKNIDNGKRMLHQVPPKNKRMLNALSNIDNGKKMLVPLKDQNAMLNAAENIDNIKYVKVNRALPPKHHNGCYHKPIVSFIELKNEDTCDSTIDK
ncbi:uncharacterized protein LOC116416616 [Nasonia vitripennis]|uniref:Uncharacterized protein n=1 Tax=Nasonia vitripennis TaxID=7425 RepID=A0A7M7Q890_NASVI|nr:uncharacterized protein LOC116416616 [Nasonia vitripennis]